jgi:hypothetical protein
MSNRAPRWLVPLVAALAVLAVVGVIWQQRPGATGGDSGFAGGGDSGQGSPPYAGVEPGSPGVEPPPSDRSGTGDVPDADQGSIAVTSFYRYDATHLALNYTNGIPECYGAAGTPRVEETPDAVVVTIPRTPVKSTGDRACIDIAMLGTVDVTLASPLAGRPVLDGARQRTEVDEAAAPNDPNQAN